MKKIEYLFDGNFEINGQMFHRTQGQVEDVPEVDAARLIEGKCAVEYREKKEVKHERKNKQ